MSLLPTALELMEPCLIANLVLLIGLSLVIVYQAYRGYQRRGSRPMLFLGLGVILLTIVPTVVSIVAAYYVSAVTFGFTSIVCSLYGRRKLAGQTT